MAAPPENPHPVPVVRGKWIIIAMVVMGCLGGTIAVLVQHQLGHRCLTYWGRENALLIRDADRVEWQVVEWRGPPAPTAAAENREGSTTGSSEASEAGYRVVERLDITAAPGIQHARALLLADDSFRWGASPEPRPERARALVFARGERTCIILIDPESHRLWRAGGSQALDYSPSASFWERWIHDQDQALAQRAGP